MSDEKKAEYAVEHMEKNGIDKTMGVKTNFIH